VNGNVDRADRALIKLAVRSDLQTVAHSIVAWIDTAFTGELVVPRSTITQLGLRQSSFVSAGLADGKQVILGTFSCVIEWFGERRQVEVIESDGAIALLGTGLLRTNKVEIDYRLGTVVIS
jgi:clan AA aspartic protease